MTGFKQTPNTGFEGINISGLKDFLESLTDVDKKLIRDQIEQGVIVEEDSQKETIAILNLISYQLSKFQKEYNLSDSDFEEVISFCLDSLSMDTSSVINGVKGRVINVFGFEGNSFSKGDLEEFKKMFQKGKGEEEKGEEGVQAWAYYREDIMERKN